MSAAIMLDPKLYQILTRCITATKCYDQNLCANTIHCDTNYQHIMVKREKFTWNHYAIIECYLQKINIGLTFLTIIVMTDYLHLKG